MDSHPDSADEGRWMTYDQIAAARGISRASAERLVNRQKGRWRRQADNKGTVRFLVPLTVIPDTSPDSQPDMSADIIAAQAKTIEALAVRAERAEAEADRAIAALAAERERTAAADAARITTEATLAAERAAAAAREAAWRSLGRVARLRRAWRAR